MKISKDFIGGNISVQSIENISDNDVCVHLKNEIRDTEGDWFYWAFKVSGAQGKKVKFIFDEPHRVGYFGAAVSLDLKNWNWVGNAEGESFTYTFGENETEVYFAHHMLYHPDRFENLCKELGLQINSFCKTEKGREVPYLEFGDGDKYIVLTSRHHACESTGDYVLEGVLREISTCESILKEFKILCVPFVDFDGVVDGDQGKGRNSHDHNRDYCENEASIYNTTAKIREFGYNNFVKYSFDFHSPWHKTGMNDTAFIVHNTLDKERVKAMREFSTLFFNQVSSNDKSFRYYSENDLEYGVDWNIIREYPGNCSAFFSRRKNNKLAFTLETAYFGSSDGANKVSQSNLVELGKCFAKTLIEYINK